MSSDKNNQEKQALHYFATAFLINFIFGFISIIINFSYIGLAFVAIGASPPHISQNILGLSFFSFIISGVGMLLFIYYLWHGFDLITRVNPEFSMGKIGSILMIFSIFVYPSLIPILNIPFNNIAALTIYFSVIVLLSIIGLVGMIMVIIALFKMGKHYDSTIIKIGAILYIFVGFIGAILLYIGFKDVENKPFEKKSVILPPKPPW